MVAARRTRKPKLARTKQVAKDLYRAYLNWQAHEGSQMAASVAFFMAISFFPLLLVLISVMGLLLRFSGWGQDARDRLFHLIGEQTAPALAEQVQAVLSNVQANAVVGGPVGLVTLFFASMAVFVHFDNAMDRIWNVERPSPKGVLGTIRSVLVDRFRAFLMLLGVGVFVIAGFLASMTLSAVGQYFGKSLPIPRLVWDLATLAPAVGLNWLLFTVIYKALPKVPVRWSDAAWGALLAAVMWEGGRRLLAAYVIGSRFSVYGVVGSFVAIMLWAFYAVAILFLGAEYIQVSRARCPEGETGERIGEPMTW